jgi:uncharacterized protein YuzE
MKIQYDLEVDALYIELREAHAARSLDIEEGVTVDLDEKNGIGRVGILPALGIEILDA